MADDNNSEIPLSRGWRPVPDPTVLTNEAVAKAIDALREILEARIKGIEEKVTLIDANMVRHVDIAIDNLNETVSARINANSEKIARLDDEIGQKVGALNILLDEKIRALTETVVVFKTAVNERFQLGDVQTEKAARDVKSAVDAAFAAAKEAVGEQNKSNALSIAKSEVSTTKQLDQLAENLRLSVKTSDDKIGDLKDRIIAIEGQSTGSRTEKADVRSLTFSLIAAVCSILAVTISAIGFALYTSHLQH